MGTTRGERGYGQVEQLWGRWGSREEVDGGGGQWWVGGTAVEFSALYHWPDNVKMYR